MHDVPLLLQIHARYQLDSHDCGILNRDRRESFLISSIVPQTVDSRRHSFRRTQSWLRHITEPMKPISRRTQRGGQLFPLPSRKYQPATLPTESAEWDVSRWEYTKSGEGTHQAAVRAALDARNCGRSSDVKDALIAEVGHRQW